MSDIFNTYISKVYIQSQTTNNDIVSIETKFFSDEGDVFTLDRRTLTPNILITTQSLAELKPEISDTYPFKIVPPVLDDGTTILLSPTVDTPVTASQNYYVPIYFERYDADVMRRIDKDFNELTSGSTG